MTLCNNYLCITNLLILVPVYFARFYGNFNLIAIYCLFPQYGKSHIFQISLLREMATFVFLEWANEFCRSGWASMVSIELLDHPKRCSHIRSYFCSKFLNTPHPLNDIHRCSKNTAWVQLRINRKNWNFEQLIEYSHFLWHAT